MGEELRGARTMQQGLAVVRKKVASGVSFDMSVGTSVSHWFPISSAISFLPFVDIFSSISSSELKLGHCWGAGRRAGKTVKDLEEKSTAWGNICFARCPGPVRSPRDSEV